MTAVRRRQPSDDDGDQTTTTTAVRRRRQPNSSDNDDRRLEAKDVLVLSFVDDFPLDVRPDRRIRLAHVQRQRIRVRAPGGQRARQPASFARVHVIRRPRDRNVSDDGVDFRLSGRHRRRRRQQGEFDGGGDVGSPDDPASHVGGVSASLELHRLDLGQGRAAVLPDELRPGDFDFGGVDGRTGNGQGQKDASEEEKIHRRRRHVGSRKKPELDEGGNSNRKLECWSERELEICQKEKKSDRKSGKKLWKSMFGGKIDVFSLNAYE